MPLIIAALLAVTLGVTSPRVMLDGVFALQAARSQTQAHLVATQIGGSPLAQRIDLWLTRDNSQTVDRYDVDMTKYLHLIAISDDFTTFLHVHPVFGKDHHFRTDVTFPKAGLYHVYADGEPGGIGRQVFRYDLRIGSQSDGVRDLAPTGRTVTSGTYRVALDATQLHAGAESKLAVHITRDGRPANDLHPYLGALAHAVFVDADDLSYAHVHPMPLVADGEPSMAGMDMGEAPNSAALADSATSSPDMLLHVRLREAGTYKLWLQFRGKDGVHAAPFVLTVA